MNSHGRKAAAAWLSVFSNTLLVVLKVVIGIAIGSVSVISEAIHSGVDLLAAVIALVAVKASAKPADRHHPFGHGKAENISGTVEAVLIFVAAGWIIYEAIKKIIHPAPIEHLGWGVGVMLLSAAANLGVSHWLFRVARQTESVALEADAWHLRTDVYTSAGVMGGLALIWAGEWLLQRRLPGVHLHWIDPVAAIVVAVLIIHAAWVLTSKSAGGLMDENLPAEEEAWIRDLAKTLAPTVRGLHSLRTRKSGPDRFVEFHLMVDASMSVEKSHEAAHEVADRVEGHFPNCSVTVHVEPCAGQCEPDCVRRCLLSRENRRKMQRGRPRRRPAAV